MGASFVVALDAEISDLKGELERDVRFMRLRELERIRHDLYGDQNQTPPRPSVTTQPKVAAKPPLRKPSPDRLRALEAAQTLIRESDGPVPTAEIFRELQDLAIPISGENPLNNLSAMLSNSGLFDANGRAGWTLKQSPADVTGEPNPDDLRDAAAVRETETESGRLPPDLSFMD